MQDPNLQSFQMNNKKKLVFIIIFVFLSNCSFDDKTGIWSGSKEEKNRISELEEKQNEVIDINKIYSSENKYTKEIILKTKINLTEPSKNISWYMSGLNNQNFLGNIYSTGIDKIFLKKKIGKNYLSLSQVTNSILFYRSNIILSDDKGTIFNINNNGKINWKKNIYKKIYKKIYKNLSLSIYKDKIYVADNIGFIYAISLDSGNIIWIKNHGIPLKSKIKIFQDKIFLINQENRILSFSIEDGSVIWDIRSISSFIKSQNLLSLAVSKQGYIIASTSAGDLLKINSRNGKVLWSLNTLGSSLEHATDFFKSSDVVISNKSIIFSTHSSIFSFNMDNGFINWEIKLSSIAIPIIDGNNIFFVSESGYFVILDLVSGKIISSTNILKILKKKHQSTKITGFIMGSGKIYAATLNGFLIVGSAYSGKAESFIKIKDPITSSPIINNGKLYLYTEKSKIIGFH